MRAASRGSPPRKLCYECTEQAKAAAQAAYEEKLKEIEGVCNPIVSKVYQQGGDDDADSYGDDDDDDDHDEL